MANFWPFGHLEERCLNGSNGGVERPGRLQQRAIRLAPGLMIPRPYRRARRLDLFRNFARRQLHARPVGQRQDRVLRVVLTLMDLRQVRTIVTVMKLLLARREPFDRGGKPGDPVAHPLERRDRIVRGAGRGCG